MGFKIGVVEGSLKAGQVPADVVAAGRQVGVEGLQVRARPPKGVSLDDHVAAWKAAIDGSGLEILSAVTGFPQEDYSSIQRIHETGGLVPDECAEANLQIAIDGAKFAAGVGADLVTFHAGFIPEDAGDAVFGKLADRLGHVADAAGELGIRVGLESGQESAAALLAFLDALGRENVGVNFDPANMILYGRQDPIDAVDVLKGRIFQAHAKDGVWSEKPGEVWGKEVPLGEGDVQVGRWLSRLRTVGFAGNVVIEREGGANSRRDVADAVEFLKSMR